MTGADSIPNCQTRGDDFREQPVLGLHVVVDEMFGENSYIAYLEGREDCIVFDPGFDHRGIVQFCRTAT